MNLLSLARRLVGELKRRHVFRVAVVYATVAFVVVQAAALVYPALGIPDWAYSLVVVLALLGFPVALVLAWALELTPDGVRPAEPMTVGDEQLRLRKPLLAVSLLGVVAVGVIAAIRLGSHEGPVPAGTNTVAVAPLVPAVPDSSLTRLGRELVVTLSANLEDAAGLRTASPLAVLAQVESGRSLNRPAAAEMARELGAANVLYGTILNDGGEIRLDFELLSTEGLETLARASASAPADDLAALTDSATLALLRRVWVRGESPIPSIGALTTRSVEALKAYVEGEEALATAEFDDAVRAFERAYDADTTFWFAYWRSLYPRVYEGSRPDSALLAEIWERRRDFPAPDRALLESDTADVLSTRLTAKRALTQRFPTYWPGWYNYANLLVHWAPYLGTGFAEARSALEETVVLAPQFAPAWEHLFWTAVMQRDSARAMAAFRRMESYGSDRHFKYHPDLLRYYRTINDLVRSDGRLSPALAEETADYFLGYTGPLPRIAFGLGLMDYGFGQAQVQLSDAVLRRDPDPRLAAAMWLGKALGWARRGTWDSALVAADRWVRISPTGKIDEAPDAPLVTYGLAVAGAHLGFIHPDVALSRRPETLGGALDPAEAEAEGAWLDGLLAVARGNGPDLVRARRKVQTSGSQFVGLLDGSLAAFAGVLQGDSLTAGQELARLEMESAERHQPDRYGRTHPFVSALNRLSASRWLLSAGDTAGAARLLSWHEAELWDRHRYMDAVHQAFAPLAYVESGRIAEWRGLDGEARRHYSRFLEARDHGDVADSLVRESRAALLRLEGTVR